MGAHARIVWRKTDRRIVTGNEDVAFYLHFPLPCRKGRSLYNDSRMPRKFNVTEKFNLWCERFTNSIVDEGLTKMCSDTTSRVPSMARQLSLELTQAEQIQGLDYESTSLARKRRRKRFIFEVLTVVVVGIVALFSRYSHVTNVNTAQDAEKATEENFNRLKILGEETDAALVRYRQLVEQMNVTVNKIIELNSRVEELELASNIENQALVASLVSKGQITSENLRQIGLEWAAGIMTEKLTHTLGYSPPCLRTTCPLTLHQAKRCEYKAKSRDAKFIFRRTRVRGDITIVKADAFRYYLVPEFTKTNEQHKFWLTHTKGLRACVAEYVGPTHLASNQVGCLQQINPPNPTSNDVPTLLGGCITKLTDIDLKIYSLQATCKSYTWKAFDAESVQLKLEGDQLLLYCPLQQYRVNGGAPSPCELNKVMALPAQSNVTVERSPNRITDEREIINYTYTDSIYKANSTLHLPDDVRLIIPISSDEEHGNLKVVIRKLEEAKRETSHHRSWKDRVVSNFRARSHNFWSTAIKVTGSTLVMAIVLIVIGLSIKSRKTVNTNTPINDTDSPYKPRVPTLKKNPPDYHRPSVRFVEYAPEPGYRHY